MASPGKARGAKSLANLKRGNPGNKSTHKTAEEKEVQKIAKKLLDPKYLKNLKARLLSGKIQPGVEVAIWQYAHGRPKELIETKQIVPIRISHEYTE